MRDAPGDNVTDMPPAGKPEYSWKVERHGNNNEFAMLSRGGLKHGVELTNRFEADRGNFKGSRAEPRKCSRIRVRFRFLGFV